MNIIISVDSNYLEKAKTMLFSLYLHNKKEDIKLFVLNYRLTNNECAELKNYLLKKCEMKVFFIDIGHSFLDEFPIIYDRFSVEMYYRILAQFLLPSNISRALWLDADIVIMKNISEFYNQSFNEKLYVVCEDSENKSEYVQVIAKKLGLSESHKYFNSGVLLINLEKLRLQTSLSHIIEISTSIKDCLTCPDQDILNYIYSGKVKYNDWKMYNYQLSTIEKIPSNELKRIKILHYSGPNKPWNDWQINSTSKYYWKIRIRQGCFKQTASVYIKRFYGKHYKSFYLYPFVKIIRLLKR